MASNMTIENHHFSNQGRPFVSLRSCPRCETGTLTTNTDAQGIHYHDCLQCGFHKDLDPQPKPSRTIKRSLLSRGDKIAVRYKGESEYLEDIVLQFTYKMKSLPRGWPTDASYPLCPFAPCLHAMELVPPSGTRRDKTERRYLCPDSHRVSIFMADGNLFWR